MYDGQIGDAKWLSSAMILSSTSVKVDVKQNKSMIEFE